MSMHENTLCKAAFGDILLDTNGDVLPCCFIKRNSNNLKIKDDLSTERFAIFKNAAGNNTRLTSSSPTNHSSPTGHPATLGG